SDVCSSDPPVLSLGDFCMVCIGLVTSSDVSYQLVQILQGDVRHDMGPLGTSQKPAHGGMIILHADADGGIGAIDQLFHPGVTAGIGGKDLRRWADLNG